MQFLGNVLLGLATLLYVYPLQVVLNDPAGRRADGGLVWGAIFALGPLWLLTALALETAVFRGGLDWTGWRRGWLAAAVPAACLALAATTFFSALGKWEPQIPWAAKPLAGWAALVFPLAALAFAFLSVNPGLGGSAPRWLWAGPMAAVVALSALVSFAMIFEAMAASQARQMRRAEAEVERQQAWDDERVERLETLDPVADFPELLGMTNRFNDVRIREGATAKIRSREDYVAALADALENGWPDSGLTYLDATDVSAEEQAALAPAVAAAIRALTGMARRSIEQEHTLYAEQFDRPARLMTSVADKFRDQDVDYTAAIREYRAALDEGKAAGVRLNARAMLDAWLARRR